MYRYWGKASKTDAAYHLLVYHCLDVAAVAHHILEADTHLHDRLCALVPDMAPGDLTALFLYFAALHDLGKFGPAFQHKRPDLVTLLGGEPLRFYNREHHSHLGQALFFDRAIRRAWPEALRALPQDEARDILGPLAQAAFGHHGRPPQGFDGNLRLPPATVEALQRFLDAVVRLTLPPGLRLPDGDAAEDCFKPISWLFAGLLVLADWIASGSGFAYVATPMPLAEYYADHALPQARTAVYGSGILCPPPRRGGEFHTLLPHIKKEYAPTPLQAHALAVAGTGNGPQLFIFEDATGAGKTEAALLAAHALMTRGAAEGFYIGLPTMATANGMYARLAASYRALFEEATTDAPSLMLAHGARGINDAFLDSIGLEHGKPSDSDEEDGNDTREAGAFCAAWLADNRKKALLAPCGVGTLDQALLAVLPAKHQCLRLLGLGRNVLVADEVHAYDPYTTRLLERLLTFHAGLGGSAILLSATLPRRIKQRLAAAFCEGAGYDTPRLTDKPLPLATRLASGVFGETPLPQTHTRSIAVEMTDSVERAYDRLAAVHAAGGCAILFCNTVDRAVAAHARLAARLPADDLLLFHARFALCDRLAIEKRVLSIFGKDATPESRRGKILVATQVAEQSLDIDGDFIVTELAPMELILQRTGRGHRHQRPWRPEGFETPAMLVIAPRVDAAPDLGWGEAELGKGLFVYPAHDLLWRTATLLAARERIELPRDARELVEGAYDEDSLPTPAALTGAEDKAKGKDCAENSLAEANALDFWQGYGESAADGGWYDDRIVPTRLGEPTVTLRLLKVVGDGLELWAGPEMTAHSCARSEVSVAYRRVAELAPDDAWQKRLAAFTATMPDAGRWVTLVPLAETEEPGVWRCALPGWGHLRYTHQAGLEFIQQ